MNVTLRSFRRAVASLSACLTLSLFGAPVKFDVPSQMAPAALEAFIQQSKTQVLYLPDEIKDARTNAVQGEYEPATALNAMLKDSGLTFTERSANKFSVARVKPGSIEGQVRDESGRPVAGARVALTGTDFVTETDRRGRFSFDSVPAGAQTLSIMAEGMQRTKVTDVVVKPNHRHTLGAITIPATVAGITQLEDYIVSAKKNDGVVELDPYAVSAARAKPFSTANIDLTRTRNDALPFTVFTGQNIEESGAPDLAEFLRGRLPQNFSRQLTDERNFSTASNPRGAFNALDLSGSSAIGGVNELVILVNGRRLPNRLPTLGGIENQSVTGDFRGIPIGSVARIEVLSSAGSAIYGEGATGGVINIITKSDYRGGSFNLRYENPFSGHAPKRAAELEYSTPVGSGANLRIGYSIRDSQPLNLEDRADVTIDRWRKLINDRSPSLLLFSGVFPPLGETPNIRASSGANLFGPGTSGDTSVPAGYAGGQGITPFLDRQGLFNLNLAQGPGGAGGLVARQTQLGSPTRNNSYLVGLDRQFGEKVRVTLEYYRTDSRIDGQAPNAAPLVTLQPGQGGNPFTQAVAITWSDPRLDLPELMQQLRTRNEQFTASLRGDIGPWTALLDASWSRDIVVTEFRNFIGPIGGGNSGFANAIRAGLYNPFVDMRTVAPAAATFYQEYEQGHTYRLSQAQNLQFSAKASGPIWTLPAGELVFTAGAEWIRQDRDRAYGESLVVDNRTGAILRGSLGESSEQYFTFDTLSGYAETTAPVVGSKQKIPLVENLEIFASGRISEQTRNGFRLVSTNNVPEGNATRTVPNVTAVEYETRPHLYAAGLRYQVIPGVLLRASKSIGFKPPGFSDVIPGVQPTTNTTVTDRVLNQSVTLTPAMRITGGNPDLSPETTSSVNFGLVFAPRWISGLRLSADHVKSVRDDAIAALSEQVVLNLEVTDPTIASRVRRDSTGAITLVDARTINFRRISSERLDLTLEQRFERIFGGRVTFAATATKNISTQVQSSASTAPIEQIRNPNGTFASNLPEWNGNLQARWESTNIAFGWSIRYFDSELVRASALVAQGRDRMDWAHEHDTFVSYRFGKRDGTFGKRVLSDLTVSLGIKNIFDREPRFQGTEATYGVNGADSIYGRSVWLNLRKSL